MADESFEAFVADALAKPGMSLLLTCIDYRYPRRILDAMQRLLPGVAYDQFILAGASLGACRPDWQDVLVQHVEAALFLRHDIRRIVILDHRDCGAYRHPQELQVPKEFLEHGLPKDILPSQEKAAHESVLSKVIPILRRRLPQMEFYAWLLTRDEDDPLRVPGD